MAICCHTLLYVKWSRDGDGLTCGEHGERFPAGHACPSCTPGAQDVPSLQPTSATTHTLGVGGIHVTHELDHSNAPYDLVAKGIAILDSDPTTVEIKAAEGFFKAARIVREIQAERRTMSNIAELRRELAELRALTEQAGAGRLSTATALPAAAGEASH